MSTDAIVLLKDDHKQIRKLFRPRRPSQPGSLKKAVDAVLD